ncbi:alpha-1,2-fucosyltransferase [Vagococcus humatus]|uniref:Alpha-1,2-fucosyltransferase n=1 Tax=Vagococcus humatus TaxID=1889241 RepID=A0A3R9YKN1_9ENTE|nr:alpha-1,2-fucosyltransferase [Vagococcus humatus]RST89908.1 hypothetical protein C7P63_02185 [Vagococcus humatus]
MIILRSIGGLGNQMFQYAFARAIQLESEDKDLYIDTSSYKKYKVREYDLDKLNVRYTDFQSIKFSNLNYNLVRLTQKFYRVSHKIVRTILKKPCLGENSYNFFCNLGFLYNFDFCYYDTSTKGLTKKNKYIYGYFQSEKYFEKYKEIICSELKVKVPLTEKEKEILKLINNTDSVGVSIRVGDDYVKDPLTYVCTPNYFYECMDKLKKINKDSSFFIFTDDVSKVKKNYDFPYDVVYIEGFNAIESLRLLYSCKDFIISNSSFSWWGSYLSDNQSKIVMAPSSFSTNPNLNDNDIFYKQMVKNNVKIAEYKK